MMTPIIVAAAVLCIAAAVIYISKYSTVEITAADLSLEERNLIARELELEELETSIALAAENEDVIPFSLRQARRRKRLEVDQARLALIALETGSQPAPQPGLTPLSVEVETPVPVQPGLALSEGGRIDTL